MNRVEHLQWCKDRALKYVEAEDFIEAFNSFQSDMMKHEETKNHIALELGVMLYFGGHLNTKESVIDWINGFN